MFDCLLALKSLLGQERSSLHHCKDPAPCWQPFGVASRLPTPLLGRAGMSWGTPCHSLQAGCSKVEVDLFSQVTSNRMKGNGIRFCQERFRWDIMKNFFMEIVKHWEQPDQVESPSLWVFKGCTNVVLTDMVFKVFSNLDYSMIPFLKDLCLSDMPKKIPGMEHFTFLYSKTPSL